MKRINLLNPTNLYKRVQNVAYHQAMQAQKSDRDSRRVIGELVADIVDNHSSDYPSFPALFEAIDNGDKAFLKAVFSSGSFTKGNWYSNPEDYVISYAAENASPDVLKLVLENESGGHAGEDFSSEPVYRAAKVFKAENLALLIENGHTVDYDELNKDLIDMDNDSTPLGIEEDIPRLEDYIIDAYKNNSKKDERLKADAIKTLEVLHKAVPDSFDLVQYKAKIQ